MATVSATPCGRCGRIKAVGGPAEPGEPSCVSCGGPAPPRPPSPGCAWAPYVGVLRDGRTWLWVEVIIPRKDQP